jgi:hypothetical protein
MPAFKTLEELTQDTVKLLSQVPGTSVQTYAEERINQFIQLVFDTVFDKLWWDEYMQWFQTSLDGTSGLPSSDISTIRRFMDIKSVFNAGSDLPIPRLPSENMNPFNITGTQVRFIGQSNTVEGKVLKCYPITSTNAIVIHARLQPEDSFGDEDEIKIDPWLLVLGATYMYLEDDGTNPGATEKYQNLYEDRFETLRMANNDDRVILDKYSEEVPTTWNEA